MPLPWLCCNNTGFYCPGKPREEPPRARNFVFIVFSVASVWQLRESVFFEQSFFESEAPAELISRACAQHWEGEAKIGRARP